jgi:transposase InsO family protein
VWKLLKRAGISRPPRPLREPANRYEWPCPGELLHMDASEYARFQRPGHRVTGDRSSQHRRHLDGVEIVHAIVDDHSRLAYAEIHDDQRAATVVAFLERALAFYDTHAITARRVMTDNAWAHARSRGVREPPARRQIRHLTTKPYRPRTNGKAERFHQTIAREWAYRLIYSPHRDRAAAPPHRPDHHNTRRPHTSLTGAPPTSRIHNVRGQDI